jgi:4-hydroxy-2-oxoheptanedioate aldolase
VRTNHVRQRLRNGQATIGCFLGLGSPSVAELLAHAGFDWLIIETEHNAVDIAQVEHMLMAINGTDAIPLVRVPSSDPIAIQRALDVGALGVVVPFVKTADEAAAIVAATRYPPDGRRGFGPLRAANYTFGNADYLATANDNILVVLILETREAVENLDAIASVPGVDVVYLGPADLSLAYGLQPFDSAADQTTADVLAAAVDVSRRTGIAVGHGAASPEQVRLRYDQGVTMIGYGPDYGLLATAARSGIEALPLPTSHSRDHDARDES